MFLKHSDRKRTRESIIASPNVGEMRYPPNWCHGPDEKGAAWHHTCFHHLWANYREREKVSTHLWQSHVFPDIQAEPLVGAITEGSWSIFFCFFNWPANLYGPGEFSLNPLALQPHSIYHLEDLQPTPTLSSILVPIPSLQPFILFYPWDLRIPFLEYLCHD